MSAVEILRQARELISERSNWGQGSYAVDADGEEVQPESPRAKCWCVKGAAAHFIGPTWTTSDLPLMYLDMAATKYGTGVAEAINDGEVRIGDVDPYSAVLVVLDEAIKMAEAANA